MGATDSKPATENSKNNNTLLQMDGLSKEEIDKILKYEEKDYEDLYFNKITILSNEIFESFQGNFLGEEFCNKVSFVYENQLDKLNIKVLRNIQSTMENNENNSELKLVLQHIPKNNNDKYFINFFDELLNEYFYEKNVNIKKVN